MKICQQPPPEMTGCARLAFGVLARQGTWRFLGLMCRLSTGAEGVGGNTDNCLIVIIHHPPPPLVADYCLLLLGTVDDDAGISHRSRSKTEGMFHITIAEHVRIKSIDEPCDSNQHCGGTRQLPILPAGGVFQTEPPGGCLRQALEFSETSSTVNSGECCTADFG
eukprot:scaffold150943_cov46-Cyclotella_meneghiniana.AAC.3